MMYHFAGVEKILSSLILELKRDTILLISQRYKWVLDLCLSTICSKVIMPSYCLALNFNCHAKIIHNFLFHSFCINDPEFTQIVLSMLWGNKQWKHKWEVYLLYSNSNSIEWTPSMSELNMGKYLWKYYFDEVHSIRFYGYLKTYFVMPYI